MNYNFDEVIDRRNTDAIKLERCKALFGTEDIIPLWVADMDFRTPDFILNAIQKRLEHPILGYTKLSNNFFPLLMQWIKEHHNWDVKQNWLGFVAGIVPGLSFAVQSLTEPGDEIIAQPPVYYPFFNVIRNNHRVLINNPLIERDGKFEMDFEDFESKITPKTKMFILCNPHNPGGRVWSPKTLKKVDEICTRHNILVISDEVHADMVLPGYTHTPYATVSETAAQNSVTFMAPSKVFNMPGLATSSFIIPNNELREKFVTYLEVSELNTGNLFAYAATEAAYIHGDSWRIQMLDYVQANINFVADYLKTNIPQIVPMIPEASFLLWLDCSGLGFENTDELHHFFNTEARVGLNKGTIFGISGEHHLRMNLASPRSIIEKALNQLSAALERRN